jgi:hypothetical protein
MKILTKTYVIVLLSLVIFFVIHSCKKDKIPVLTTAEVTNITGTTATSGGTISDEGSGMVVERGICWSKVISPTINNSRTADIGSGNTFTSNMSDLKSVTTYYVRAYATNIAGTGYGNEVNFTTTSGTPLYLKSSVENATPNIVEITYSMTLAGLIPDVTAFSVYVNVIQRSVSSVSISGSKVYLTLSGPIIYGDIVTVEYVKPYSNPIQTSSGEQAASFSTQTVTNNLLNPIQP